MLRRVVVILVVTGLAATLAVSDFYLMRALPRAAAFVIHNALAAVVGLCFVAAAANMQRKGTGNNLYSLLLLCIGVGMLAIHLVKIFLSRC
jgi:hypothetical protein